jgi:peptide/nickel transport system permease protein
VQRRYLYSRLLLVLPTIVGITFVVFIAVRFLPGDVVDQIYGSVASPTPELRKELSEKYSLNENFAQQYVQWMGDLFQGNLGRSIISNRPVASDLKQRMPITLELGAMALIISLLIALPVGIISAVWQDSIWDYLSRSAAIGFLAIPSFWLALLVLSYGFRWFGWTPPLVFHRFEDDPVANLKTLWLPALILGIGLAGGVARYIRSMMLEVLRQDYIRTARAKGLPGRAVVMRHALRNAMIPVITIIGLQVPLLVGGTVILEDIFSIPGMGSLLIDSVNHRDYPEVQAVVLIAALAVVLSNLAVDFTYSLIDPRIGSR